MEVVWAVGQLGAAWLALVLGLVMLPSALGVSLGISEAYMWVLVKTLEVGGSSEGNGGVLGHGTGGAGGYLGYPCRLRSSLPPPQGGSRPAGRQLCPARKTGDGR